MKIKVLCMAITPENKLKTQSFIIDHLTLSARNHLSLFQLHVQYICLMVKGAKVAHRRGIQLAACTSACITKHRLGFAFSFRGSLLELLYHVIESLSGK